MYKKSMSQVSEIKIYRNPFKLISNLDHEGGYVQLIEYLLSKKNIYIKTKDILSWIRVSSHEWGLVQQVWV